MNMCRIARKGRKLVLVFVVLRALSSGLDISEVKWCLTKADNPIFCLQHPEKGDDVRLGA